MANYPSTIASWSSVTDGVSYPLATHVNQPNEEVIAVETELGVLVKGSSTDLAARLTKSVSDAGYLDFATATTLTIATGSITPTQNYHLVDTEGTTNTDDLDTIVASSTDIRARVLFLRPAHTDRTVVIKHNTGNIYTATALDVNLDETYKYAILIYDSTLARWLCTAMIASASTSAAGIIQLATSAEITAGTDASKAITPDALAGSNFGIRPVAFHLNGTTALTTAEKVYWRVPAAFTGMNLVSVTGSVGTGAAGSSSSGTPTFTVRNVTDNQQMLSTSLTIDASEYTSATAAVAAVINTTYDDVVTDDLIEVAVTTSGTGVTYAVVTLGFQLP